MRSAIVYYWVNQISRGTIAQGCKITKESLREGGSIMFLRRIPETKYIIHDMLPLLMCNKWNRE